MVSDQATRCPDSAGEHPVCFAVAGHKVYGVLHVPAPAERTNLGVLFCHGWAGGRLGPHRMFVKIARRLSRMGIYALRVDFRGRGGSEGIDGETGIQSMIDDAIASVDFLMRGTTVRIPILLGICSGAKVAIGAAVRENRIAGLVLWSAEALGSLRETATNRRKTRAALAAYLRKLTRPGTWKKILAGRIDTRAVNKAVFSHETRSTQEAVREDADLRHFRCFSRPVLFIYGGNDPDTELAGRNYDQFCARNQIPSASHVIPEANHSFYSLAWEAEVIEHTLAWISGKFLGRLHNLET